MPTRKDVLKILAPQLYPMQPGGTVPSTTVDFRRLTPIVALALRSDLVSATFPEDGPVDPRALYDHGVDPAHATPALIARLLAHRDSFAGIQAAWLDLSGYTEPPCPGDREINALIDFINALSPPARS
jgi:hypothetical protein